MEKAALMVLILLTLLCTSCGGKAEETEEDVTSPAAVTEPEEAEDAETPEDLEGTGDTVLVTREAPLAGGRTLRLEAIGKKLDESNYGVREVRVCDGEDLLQTVSVREAKEIVWGDGGDVLHEDFYDYTECWTAEETIEALDLNSDGNMDFGLFGWPANNTIPYYYWQWDPDTEQYCYAFTLQGVKVLPETKELTAEYKSGSAGSRYVTDCYIPGEDGELRLEYRKISILEEAVPNQDTERPVWVTLIPPEGQVLKPADCGEENGGWGDSDLILARRELPLCEINEDNEAVYFTEIWELVDGELQLTSREEFSYET